MLKYLFTVQYNDGTQFNQNPEDISFQDPKKSAFYDIKQDKLITFSLVGEGHTYTVDLRDGHFEVDGVSFYMYDKDVTNIRLIYFRKHRHVFNSDCEELSHTITYRLGWQGIEESSGKNVERIMEIV